MPQYVIVLVEPKIEGNVGAIARGMMNFGLDDLVLVNPLAMAPTLPSIFGSTSTTTY